MSQISEDNHAGWRQYQVCWTRTTYFTPQASGPGNIHLPKLVEMDDIPQGSGVMKKQFRSSHGIKKKKSLQPSTDPDVSCNEQEIIHQPSQVI